MINSIKNELRNVISGKSKISNGDTIQAIARYLKDCQEASFRNQDAKYCKEEETKSLILYVDENQLWFKEIDFSSYISEGAEQKVFLKDDKQVLN